MTKSPLEALGSDSSNQKLELLIAVHKFRQEIDDLVPRTSKSKRDWDLKTIQKMTKIFIRFMDAVASEREEDDEKDTQYVLTHPASSILSDFILVLDDLKRGVINHRLKERTGYAGNSLNSVETKTIGFALWLVDLLHQEKQNKKPTLKKAREEAAAFLKEYGVKIREKKITASKLQEWHRDYNLDGSKK